MLKLAASTSSLCTLPNKQNTLYTHFTFFCFYSGPTQCVYLGVDDKAKVPLGIAAANKQQSILMRVDYKVKLPDHTFAVADKHKLIPSVHGICNIKADSFGEASGIKCYGATYIAIRHGKHDCTTMFDHGKDIKNMYNNPAFKSELCIYIHLED